MKILRKAQRGTHSSGHLEGRLMEAGKPKPLYACLVFGVQKKACPSPLFPKLETSFTEK